MEVNRFLEKPMSSQQVMLYEDNVKRAYSQTELLKKKLKEKREMLKDGLENDAEYHKLIEQGKELARKKKALAQELTRGSLFTLKQDIEELKDELKDEQMSLSDYLYTYAEETKSTSIELGGKDQRIVRNFKLQVKRV